MEETVEAKAADAKEMKPKKGEKRADFMKRCKEAGMEDDLAKECWNKYGKGIEIEIDEDEEDEVVDAVEADVEEELKEEPKSNYSLSTKKQVAKPVDKFDALFDEEDDDMPF